VGGFRGDYAAADNSLLRTSKRFARAKAANNRLAFFAKPRYRTFTNPNFSFRTQNTCSTFDRTGQRFKAVSQRHPQIIQLGRVVHVFQLAKSDALNVRRDPAAFAGLVKPFRICILKACNPERTK
jgi:hypothetical protein